MRTASGPVVLGRSRFSTAPIAMPCASKACARCSIASRSLAAVKSTLRGGMPPAAKRPRIRFAWRSSGMRRVVCDTSPAGAHRSSRLLQSLDQAADRRDATEVRRGNPAFRYHHVKLGLYGENEVHHVHGCETRVTQVIGRLDGTADGALREQPLYDRNDPLCG